MTAVWQALPIAIGLALAALPIVLIPMALASSRPSGIARAFLAGWLIGVLAVGAIVIIAADLIALPEEHPQWLSYAKIALGVALFALGVSKWWKRPRPGDAPAAPGWMSMVEVMTTGKAFGLAFLLAAANPKNLVLVVSGATVIADASSRPVEQFIALVVFTIVGSVGVAVPVVLPLILGERATPVLASANRWMTRYSSTIVATVLVVLGVLLVSNGVAGI